MNEKKKNDLISSKIYLIYYSIYRSILIDIMYYNCIKLYKINNKN